jgi:hypothetical protein
MYRNSLVRTTQRLALVAAAGTAVLGFLLLIWWPGASAAAAEASARGAAESTRSPSDKPSPKEPLPDPSAAARTAPEQPRSVSEVPSPSTDGKCSCRSWGGCRLRFGGGHHRRGCLR